MNKGLRELDAFQKINKMSRKAKDSTYRKLFPEYFVDQKLKALEQSNAAEKSYCDLVENYLQRARESMSDDINSALLNNLKLDFEHENLSRIVRAKFSNDPLCSFGSVRRPPGGRFNFGQSTRRGSEYFQALYLGNDYDTSFHESFHSKDESIGDFSHFKVKAKLDKYLDLRNKKVIEDFYDVIGAIKLPPEFKEFAAHYGVEPMSLVKNAKELQAAIFSERYKAWDTWVDQYSTSQWFGFYAYSLGIPAIIYPSIRYKEGFNLAIYMDNFKDTKNTVTFKTPGDWEHVPENRKYINSENHCDLQRSISKYQ